MAGVKFQSHQFLCMGDIIYMTIGAESTNMTLIRGKHGERKTFDSLTRFSFCHFLPPAFSASRFKPVKTSGKNHFLPPPANPAQSYTVSHVGRRGVEDLQGVLCCE